MHKDGGRIIGAISYGYQSLYHRYSEDTARVLKGPGRKDIQQPYQLLAPETGDALTVAQYYHLAWVSKRLGAVILAAGLDMQAFKQTETFEQLRFSCPPMYDYFTRVEKKLEPFPTQDVLDAMRIPFQVNLHHSNLSTQHYEDAQRARGHLILNEDALYANDISLGTRLTAPIQVDGVIVLPQRDQTLET